MSGLLPQHQRLERVRERLIETLMALDAYLPYDDLNDLMDWLDGERLYAAGRGDPTRARAFTEVQRELRERRLARGDFLERSMEAAKAVIEAFVGDEDERAG